MKKLLLLVIWTVFFIHSSINGMRKIHRGLSMVFRNESRLYQYPFQDPSYTLLTAQTKKMFPEHWYNERAQHFSSQPFSLSSLTTFDHENKERNFVVMRPLADQSAVQQPLVYARSLDPITSLNTQSLDSIFSSVPFGIFKRALVAPQSCHESRMKPEGSEYDIWSKEAGERLKKAAHLSRRFSSTLRRPLLVAESLGVLTALKVLTTNPTLFSGALFINPIGDMDYFMEENPWLLEYLKNIPAFRKEGETAFYENRFNIADLAPELRTRCLLIEGRKDPYHSYTFSKHVPTLTQVVHIPGEVSTSECSSLIPRSAGHYIGHALQNFMELQK